MNIFNIKDGVILILIGKVVDNIWATRKDEALIGMKLMIVELLCDSSGNQKLIVAADIIGAGIGEKVLITQGSSARQMKKVKDVAIDAIIVGIIDEDCPIPVLFGVN